MLNHTTTRTYKGETRFTRFETSLRSVPLLGELHGRISHICQIARVKSSSTLLWTLALARRHTLHTGFPRVHLFLASSLGHVRLWMQPSDMLLFMRGRLGSLERPSTNVALLRLVLLLGVRMHGCGDPSRLVCRRRVSWGGTSRARVAGQRVSSGSHGQRPHVGGRGGSGMDRKPLQSGRSMLLLLLMMLLLLRHMLLLLLRTYGDCHLS